jgi:hypothetical protein
MVEGLLVTVRVVVAPSSVFVMVTSPSLPTLRVPELLAEVSVEEESEALLVGKEDDVSEVLLAWEDDVSDVLLLPCEDEKLFVCVEVAVSLVWDAEVLLVWDEEDGFTCSAIPSHGWINGGDDA